MKEASILIGLAWHSALHTIDVLPGSRFAEITRFMMPIVNEDEVIHHYLIEKEEVRGRVRKPRVFGW